MSDKDKTTKDEVVENLEDVKPVEDFFEKILNEDIEPPSDQDEEASAEKTEKEEPDKEESKEESNEDEESVEALKAKIAELERERKGQLGDVVKSRQERQRMKSELNQLKDAVESLLEQRKEALTEEEEPAKAPLDDTKAAVQFEDDKAYVDLAEVKEAIATATGDAKKELEQLRFQKEQEIAQQKWIKNVRDVVSEDERFTDAFQKLKTVYEDFNNQIIALQERTENFGDGGVLDVDTALDLFSGSPEEEEFKKQYPDVDVTRVARAFNTKADLRGGLRHVTGALKIEGKAEEEDAKLDEKIAKAKNKPGTLAHQENRSSGDTSDLIERIASMNHKDFESLSDAEAARIEQMLLREELQGD